MNLTTEKGSCEHPPGVRVIEILALPGRPFSYRGHCQLCGTQGPERSSRSAAAWAFGHLASMWIGPFTGAPEAKNGH